MSRKTALSARLDALTEQERRLCTSLNVEPEEYLRLKALEEEQQHTQAAEAQLLARSGVAPGVALSPVELKLCRQLNVPVDDYLARKRAGRGEAIIALQIVNRVPAGDTRDPANHPPGTVWPKEWGPPPEGSSAASNDPAEPRTSRERGPSRRDRDSERRDGTHPAQGDRPPPPQDRNASPPTPALIGLNAESGKTQPRAHETRGDYRKGQYVPINGGSPSTSDQGRGPLFVTPQAQAEKEAKEKAQGNWIQPDGSIHLDWFPAKPLDPQEMPWELGLISRTNAFRLMPRASKVQLYRYCWGNEPQDWRARDALTNLYYSDKYQNATPEHQSKMLQQFAAAQSELPGNATSSRRTPTRAPPLTSRGVKLASRTDQMLLGEMFEMQVDGRVYQLQVDTESSAARPPTKEQVALSIARLPPWARSTLQVVHIVGKPYQGRFANGESPKNRRAAHCGEPGSIDVFPRVTRWRRTELDPKTTAGWAPVASAPIPQQELDDVLLHEAGHSLVLSLHPNPKDPFFDRWREAAVRDGVAPSSYGKMGLSGDINETIAEDLVTYARVKGTPQEAEYRQGKMLHRWQLIEQLVRESEAK